MEFLTLHERQPHNFDVHGQEGTGNRRYPARLLNGEIARDLIKPC